MELLTERQQEVLGIITGVIARGEPFPSLREIASRLGVRHKSGISGHIRALERKGYIERRQQRISDFSLCQDEHGSEYRAHAKDEFGFSLVATIPAGPARQSYDQSGEQLEFSQAYFGGGELLAVTICGDSMAGDNICSGDIAIIRMQPEASPQDIVAVRLDQDEVTLKRLRYDEAICELVASNPDYPVRQVPADQVAIIGKLVGIVRKT